MMHRLGIVFGTRRGLGTFFANLLVAFGLLSGLIQFAGQVFAWHFSQPVIVAAGVLIVCVAWGGLRAFPRNRVVRDFDRPEMTVEVKAGNLFAESGSLVIGFSDTFDTDTTNSRIINASSVQGQYQKHRYNDDIKQLDRDLTAALKDIQSSATESRKDKPGKLKRYPVGTVATLGDLSNMTFAVAYTVMGNNLVAQSSIEDLWYSLGRLWDAVYENGQRQPVAMPLVGSELARINCVDRETLLKMILLSFVARSREQLVCRRLTVVIHPRDIMKINMLDIKAFLKTL